MTRKIVKNLIRTSALLILLTGCVQGIIEKPDGTRIKVNVFGSTKLEGFHYERDGLVLDLNGVKQTPEGVGEAVGEIIGEAAKHLIRP